MDKLDLTQPLEAFHNDGRVIAVKFKEEYSDGDFVTGPFCKKMPNVWKRDGLPWLACGEIAKGWRIRNTAKPSTPSNEELTQRMADHLRARMADEPHRPADHRSALLWDEMKSIVSNLPKPVDPIDPDLVLAREIVVDILCASRLGGEPDAIAMQEKLLSGECDDEFEVRRVLDALKSRTLAAEGTAHE